MHSRLEPPKSTALNGRLMNADSEPNSLRADRSPLAKLQFCIFVVALLLLLGYRLSTV